MTERVEKSVFKECEDCKLVIALIINMKRNLLLVRQGSSFTKIALSLRIFYQIEFNNGHKITKCVSFS